jgi:hypothetical protein
MKIKLSKVTILNETIKSILDNKEYKIDVVTKFQMLGILKAFETSLMNIKTIRNEKIMEYGTTNEEGNIYIDKTNVEKFSKFVSDMDELLNSDTEIDIKPLDAKTMSDIGLTADELMVLYDIMELK